MQNLGKFGYHLRWQSLYLGLLILFSGCSPSDSSGISMDRSNVILINLDDCEIDVFKDGRSFADILEGEEEPFRDQILIENWQSSR